MTERKCIQTFNVFGYPLSRPCISEWGDHSADHRKFCAKTDKLQRGCVGHDPLYAPTEERGEGEFAWLVEMVTLDRPTYWDGRGAKTFTTDVNDALRFARREDAERALHWLVSTERRAECQSREHGWIVTGGTHD